MCDNKDNDYTPSENEEYMNGSQLEYFKHLLEDSKDQFNVSRSMAHMIRRALERIEEGSFGYCVVTGQPIGLTRLLAFPWAAMFKAAVDNCTIPANRSYLVNHCDQHAP